MMAARKIGIVSVFTFMMVMMAGRAEAFINFDIQRVGSAVLNGLQQGLQIKNEFDSNLAMLKEAQSRGYGALAQDLFTKAQNGEFGRFGEHFKGLQDETFAATHSAQAVEERKAKEEADRKAKMEAQLRAEEAARKSAETDAKAAHVKAKAKEPFWKKTYNWLKNNRSTTDAGLNAINNARNGDVANAARNVGSGVGSAVGGEDGEGINMVGGLVGRGTDLVNSGGR